MDAQIAQPSLPRAWQGWNPAKILVRIFMLFCGTKHAGGPISGHH